MRRARFVLAALAGLALSGCAMAPLPAPQASIDNLQTLRAAGIAPVAVGAFTLAPGKPEGMDKSVGIRAGIVSAPSGSFAGFLQQTLEAELKGGGRLDPTSTIVVSGELTQSDVSAGIDRGHATLGAQFKVTRGGSVVFDKPLLVQDDWDGDFMGAVAIPAAMDHYNGLYHKLVGALLSDQDFKAAAKPR